MERVRKIVVEHFGVEADKVVESANFMDDLGADSLDAVELIMAFEEEFDCKIANDAAEHIRSVRDVVHYLRTTAKNADACCAGLGLGPINGIPSAMRL